MVANLIEDNGTCATTVDLDPATVKDNVMVDLTNNCHQGESAQFINHHQYLSSNMLNKNFFCLTMWPLWPTVARPGSVTQDGCVVGVVGVVCVVGVVGVVGFVGVVGVVVVVGVGGVGVVG